MELTERQCTIIQKLIRYEMHEAKRLPHLDEVYIKDLTDLYYSVSGGVDYWEDFS